MTDAMASTRGQIRALLKARSKAVEAKDIDLLMSFYRHDVVYFDLVPPLQYVGSEALRGRFLDWFARFRGPIRQEIGDLHLSAGDGFAAAYMLIRAGGTLEGGRDIDYWVRATTCCERSNGKWLIVHEHISLPVNLQEGNAVMDLEP